MAKSPSKPQEATPQPAAALAAMSDARWGALMLLLRLLAEVVRRVAEGTPAARRPALQFADAVEAVLAADAPPQEKPADPADGFA